MTNIVRQQRDEMWEKLLKETENTYKNSELFWKKIRNLMSTEMSTKIPYLLDPNGTKLTTEEEQANEFRRYLGNIFNISREENNQLCPVTQ